MYEKLKKTHENMIQKYCPHCDCETKETYDKDGNVIGVCTKCKIDDKGTVLEICDSCYEYGHCCTCIKCENCKNPFLFCTCKKGKPWTSVIDEGVEEPWSPDEPEVTPETEPSIPDMNGEWEY